MTLTLLFRPGSGAEPITTDLTVMVCDSLAAAVAAIDSMSASGMVCVGITLDASSTDSLSPSSASSGSFTLTAA